MAGTNTTPAPTNGTPVYTWQATGTGGYWAMVGGATVGAVWGTKGAWQAHVRHTNTYGAGPSRSAALANAMGPQGAPAPVLAPPLAMQAAMPAAAPQAPAQAAPAPQVPQGRTKARTALLVAVWVLVALCTVLAGAGRLYARLPLLVAKGATRASVALRTYARTL